VTCLNILNNFEESCDSEFEDETKEILKFTKLASKRPKNDENKLSKLTRE